MDTQKTPQALSKIEPSASRHYWRTLLLTLLLIAVIALLGVTDYQQRSRLAGVQSDLQNLSFQNQELKNQLYSLQNRYTQQITQVEALAKAQAQTNDQLSKILGYTLDDWLLAESAYLARLAVARLETLGDVITARIQLTMAQQRLSRLSDPSLLPLKQMLATQLSSLSQIESFDWEGLWIRLGVLSNQMETLPFQVAVDQLAGVQPASENSAQATGWEERLSNTWSEIKELIRIRRQENTEVAPLVTLSEQAHYRLGLSLLIEQARWAVVNRQPAVFQHSLETLRNRIEAQFLQSAEPFQGVITEIDALMSVSWQPELPDMAGLIKAFDRIQADRRKEQG